VVSEDNRPPSAGAANIRDGAAVGAVIGGILGMLLGWITSTRPEAVPVIGPVVGQGVLSASIVALLAGGGIGALLGALWGSFSREAQAPVEPGSAAEGAWSPPIYPISPVPDAELEAESLVFSAQPSLPPVQTDAAELDTTILVEPFASSSEEEIAAHTSAQIDLNRNDLAFAQERVTTEADNASEPVHPSIQPGSKRVRKVPPRFATTDTNNDSNNE
jgi:hypothetical protein